jgi:REP element-mobilizing transposase RayT
MPRMKREKSATGIYHVMLRGNNKNWIFELEQDKGKLYNILKEVKDESPFKLYAYCIMNNHCHLLVKEENVPINEFMKMINQKYAVYYNRNRNKVGHVFQDRFRSEPVEDDSYFLGLIRYIHLNPLEAKLVEDPYQYKWCSYKEYFYETPLMIDSEFVKTNICPERENFRKNFINLHRGDDENLYLDTDETREARKKKIAERVFKNNGGVNEKSVKKLKDSTGMTFRDIAQVANISINMVNKYLNL